MCGCHLPWFLITTPAGERAPLPARPPDAAQAACPQCGAGTRAEFTWCPRCGAALKPHPCAHCGQLIAPGQAFCSACGAPERRA
jgi:RNA polymerase subunit RPABC4/transcription elongation factor Spt4